MSESLPIIFQDNYLVAINKPSGLLVHKSALDRHETRFALQEVRNQIGQHVYPLHRLDKPTSGILLFALSADIAKTMSLQFAEQRIEKVYLAICRGFSPDECLVDHPLVEEQDKIVDKKAQREKPAQEAVTFFKRLANIELPISVDKYPSSRYSLVECRPKTGRKHQIRRHLKHLSHPIIGDAKHGKSIHNHFFTEQYQTARLLLSAVQLTCRHPVTNQALTFNAPVDEAFMRVISAFQWQDAIPSFWQQEPVCE